ncbi:hypothetical protein [Edaphobacter aggregans]|uniref:hypothetical protein n=1 Tax=Edaphobacter aggregans TaxID=570835 RepID=UPI00054E422D|nr:hypothetical protein [Edaphobacter aggregans]
MITFDEDDTKPGSRKLWHDLVERAIRTAIDRGEPFEIEKVLNSVGILHWSLYRAEAFAYANKLLDAHRKATTQEAQP